jgi:hypothetical protein
MPICGAPRRLDGTSIGVVGWALALPSQAPMARWGTTALIFDRQDFIAKLAVLVPAPRAHLTRYHGLLGPSAAWRSLVVPTAGANEPPPTTSPDSESMPTVVTSFEPPTPSPPATKTRSRNYTWSELMKRVFLVDVLQCEICGSAMKIIAAIPQSPSTVQKILECLGLPTRPPPLKLAVADPNLQID